MHMFLYVEISIHILRFRGNSIEKEKCFQQMALEQLNIHVEKRKKTLIHISNLYKNELKMDHRH